jgi:hypothetical protein
MVMTHWYGEVVKPHMNILLSNFFKDMMRTMHNAILVGSGTALNDDPQLNGALNLLPFMVLPVTLTYYFN